MNSIAEWQEITVTQQASFDPSITLHSKGIKRKDGFTLIRTGLGREFQETFICKGIFGEFEFIASRWDEWKNEPTDTYILTISLWNKPALLAYELKERVILSHAKDIEAALLRFPPIEFRDLKPGKVKRVLFNVVNETLHSHRLVSANEL